MKEKKLKKVTKIGENMTHVSKKKKVIIISKISLKNKCSQFEDTQRFNLGYVMWYGVGLQNIF